MSAHYVMVTGTQLPTLDQLLLYYAVGSCTADAFE